MCVTCEIVDISRVQFISGPLNFLVAPLLKQSVTYLVCMACFCM